MRRAVLSCLSALSLLFSTVALASEGSEGQNANEAVQAAQPKPPGIPKTRLYLADLSLIRLGPLGLETQNRLVLQRRLMDSESKLFRDTYVNGALSLKLNPAYFKLGPTIDIQPIALLNLRLGYEYMRFFGTFGYVQSFDEPTSDAANSFELEVRNANSDAGLNYITAGHHFFVEPTVQARVGKIAIRSKFAIEYWKMPLENGDKVFYDATLHTLVPSDGVVWTNDTDLLWAPGGKLTAGIRYSGVFPQYDEGDFQSGSIPDNAISGAHHKIGPLVAYSFNTRDYTGFNRPTILFVGGWYLKHPNPVEAKFPYILVAFAFNSDFLRGR